MRRLRAKVCACCFAMDSSGCTTRSLAASTCGTARATAFAACPTPLSNDNTASRRAVAFATSVSTMPGPRPRSVDPTDCALLPVTGVVSGERGLLLWPVGVAGCPAFDATDTRDVVDSVSLSWSSSLSLASVCVVMPSAKGDRACERRGCLAASSAALAAAASFSFSLADSFS